MAQVKAIPDGYTTVTASMNIEGAAEAIDFYKKAFGAEERGRMLDPSNGLIMHAEIKIGNSIIMLADAMGRPPTKSSLHLYVEDADAWFKRATNAGAQVIMPLADQFWGDRWGLMADKWGNQWGIATHKEDPTPEQMQQRFEEAMKTMKRP